MDLQRVRKIDFHAILPYCYAAGRTASRFFTELRDHKRFMATRCPSCGKAFLPPRPVCGECYVPLEDWVEVGPRGTLVGYTVVYYPFLDPLTGKERPAPYGYGFILLDSVSTKIQHFIEETDISKLRFGVRVEPVFEEHRKGSFADIRFFRIVNKEHVEK